MPIALRRALLGLLMTAATLAGQQQPAQARPNVFFDCQGFNCNDQFYRTEIAWVNWIRVPEESQVHIIMTSEQTGAGGRQYQLDFIGRGTSAGYADQIRIQTAATDTQVEQLDAITNALGVGLARFAAVAGFRGIVRVEGVQADVGIDQQRLVTNQEVDDPWNLWSFRLNANSDLEGESKEKEIQLNGGFSASRVTPTWKSNLNSNVFYNHREIERNDGTIFLDEFTDWSVQPLLVYALAEHWSVGLRGEVRRERAVNQRLFVQMTPAVEYSFFPYDEATRRSLTAFYTIGPGYRDYYDETLLGELSETRLEQTLSLGFSQRQPWGDASVNAQFEQFLHDLEKYRVSIEGDLSFRVIRGLSLNIEGDVAKVKNQIYLSAEGETDEEALLDLRQRATTFDYSVSVGFSLQFGSIFNNVVNNRFPNGGGGDRRRF